MTSLPEWNGKVVHANEKNFSKEVLKESKPVLVDFWSPSCRPCRLMIPLVEKIVDKYKGEIKVVTVNVEENPKLASRFGIQSIPNILFFKSGTVQEQILGHTTDKKLDNAILSLSM